MRSNEKIKELRIQMALGTAPVYDVHADIELDMKYGENQWQPYHQEIDALDEEDAKYLFKSHVHWKFKNALEIEITNVILLITNFERDVTENATN